MMTSIAMATVESLIVTLAELMIRLEACEAEALDANLVLSVSFAKVTSCGVVVAVAAK